MKLATRFQVQICVAMVLVVVCRCNAATADENDDRIELSAFGTRIYGNPQKSAGAAVRQWHQSQKQGEQLKSSATNQPQIYVNPEELGPYAEGDILVPRKATATGRNGMVSESYRWTNGEVPFEIVGSFNAKEMDLIEKAINAYHENTCIKYVPRSHIDSDYISIQNGQSGCWSSVGRIGGRQVVNLQSPGCLVKVGTVMHELMHAVGFLHEQNREERDQYVDIRLENVRKGYEVNFERAATGTSSGFGVGYDYGSVMHYSEGAFSNNGQPTIRTRVWRICF